MTAIDVHQVLTDVIEVSAPAISGEAALLAAAADLPGLAALLAAVRRGRATLAFVESELETLVAGLMSSNVVVIPEVGVLERRQGKKRTSWDHARLASLLAARVGDRRFDPASGEELARPPAVLAQDVADELLACVGISYWKAGALKARGLDPATFCEEEAGRATVMVRANA